MKRALFCVLFVSRFAIAESDNHADSLNFKLNRHKLWNIAALPAYFFLEDAIHESSHALMGVALGGTITKYRPYPHEADQGFMLGETEIQGSFTSREHALILMAPYITDTVVFTSSDVLLSARIVRPESLGGLILYTAGMIAPFVNSVYEANIPNPQSDLNLASRELGVDKTKAQLIIDAVALIGAWQIVLRGKEVLFEHAAHESSRVMFAPQIGRMNGLAAIMRF